MTDTSPTPAERYYHLIDQIVQLTLKGQVRSKAQLYRRLQAEVDPGEAALFEQCLSDRLRAVEAALATATDDLKQAKATRQQRALHTLAGEWTHYQQEHQSTAILSSTLATLLHTSAQERLTALLQALDPNRPDALNQDQIQMLVQQLRQLDGEPTEVPSLRDLAQGLQQGLATWQMLQAQVIGWIYDQAQRSLGFGSHAPQGPWPIWARQLETGPIRQIFQDLAEHHCITAAGLPGPVALSTWLELAIVLQRLQRALVVWFDEQPYDPQAGKRLSIATYLTFAVVWGQLSQRFQALQQPLLTEGCFQMALQGLRQFAQQPYFPLYGGLFTALSGESLHTLLEYFDQPLRQVPNTSAKARILTLLGYSQRALGHYALARQFHERALESARAVEDGRCEIANLNHLSRTAALQRAYEQAIAHSQRALILARQSGDRLGEANALANVGYSQVCRIQDQNQPPEQIASVLTYLEQGLTLSERLQDRPSQALCANSLGVGRVLLRQYDSAVPALEEGLRIAQAIGDQFLQGVNYSYLAIAYLHSENLSMAVFCAALGMYLLWQIQSSQWHQPAGTLVILQGQLGPAAFQAALTDYRAAFLRQIGVDGYDYLPTLLAEYRQRLE